MSEPGWSGGLQAPGWVPPTPTKAATVRLTCGCGEVMEEAWGPRTVRADGVREETCPRCGRALRFKPDKIAGMPLSVTVSPADPDVALADWGD